MSVISIDLHQILQYCAEYGFLPDTGITIAFVAFRKQWARDQIKERMTELVDKTEDIDEILSNELNVYSVFLINPQQPLSRHVRGEWA